ncbi:Dabb family protein [Nibrella viscosa]|uniref:Dabb family protein n=2 Tax=Nibrella viscosa TaxID=1084524 RepID=A0ABP8KQU6_9BACT
MTLSGGITMVPAAMASPDKKRQVIHHVFFWLKNPNSTEDLNKLLDGLRSLEKIEAVRQYHIGIPALTEARAVVDKTYAVSALSFFDDLEGQNAYQVHPLHKKFVETCSPLWSRIQVYDAVDL